MPPRLTGWCAPVARLAGFSRCSLVLAGVVGRQLIRCVLRLVGLGLGGRGSRRRRLPAPSSWVRIGRGLRHSIVRTRLNRARAHDTPADDVGVLVA